MPDFFSDSSILVTGGAGFIGSHLVEELVGRHAQVTVVDDLSSGDLKNLTAVIDHIELREFDLRENNQSRLLRARAFDFIFHLAGHATVPESVKSPRRDLEKNLLATFNLLESVREFSPQTRLLFTSSAAVYGESSGELSREEDTTLPLAPYGVSKLAAERYVDVYARVYGMRTASVRLFPVYGPRLRHHVVWDLMWKIHTNPRELEIHGDGNQVRDFNYVSNAVQALLTVAEHAPLRGEVYNVGSGEPISIRDLAQLICEKMGASPRFNYTGDVGPGVSLRWSADIARLQQLGYQPQRGLDEGLDDTVAWFRQEMKS